MARTISPLDISTALLSWKLENKITFEPEKKGMSKKGTSLLQLIGIYSEMMMYDDG